MAAKKRCAACEALAGKRSSAPPHPQLERLANTSAFAGHNFVVQHYHCFACDARLLRDMDRRDDGARWEYESPS